MTAREQTLVDVAANVAGPVLTSYVYWVLCQAQSEGLQKLYFVSRDGQILFRIAERLNEYLKFPIQLRYLYGGRQAWNLPSLFDLTDDDMTWLFYAPEHLTVRVLFQRLQIRPEDIAETLICAGFSPELWGVNLTQAQRIQLQHKVMSLEALRQMILKRAEWARASLAAYLKQEGVLDPMPWGLVDVGWFGRLQHSLGRVLKSEGAQMPTGYYFALSPKAREDSFGIKRAYYYDGRIHPGPDCLSMAFATWLEIFTAADHGIVMGYEKRDEKYRPVLKEETNTQAITWGILLVQKTIEVFAENCAIHLTQSYQIFDMRERLKALLARWLTKPRRDEAVVWGSFCMATDQIDAYQYPVARKLNFKDVFNMMKGHEISDLTYLSWPAGCQVLTPIPMIITLKLVFNVRRGLRFVIRKLRSLFQIIRRQDVRW